RFPQRHRIAGAPRQCRACEIVRNAHAGGAVPPFLAGVGPAALEAALRSAPVSEKSGHALAHILLVVIANAFIADPGGDLAKTLLKFGPPLRRLETSGRGFARPDQFRQRPRLR